MWISFYTSYFKTSTDSNQDTQEWGNLDSPASFEINFHHTCSTAGVLQHHHNRSTSRQFHSQSIFVQWGDRRSIYSTIQHWLNFFKYTGPYRVKPLSIINMSFPAILLVPKPAPKKIHNYSKCFTDHSIIFLHHLLRILSPVPKYSQMMA